MPHVHTLNAHCSASSNSCLSYPSTVVRSKFILTLYSAWIAWFPFLFYMTIYISEIYNFDGTKRKKEEKKKEEGYMI